MQKLVSVSVTDKTLFKLCLRSTKRSVSAKQFLIQSVGVPKKSWLISRKMAMKVNLSSDFQITDEIPAVVDEALKSGLQHFTILNNGFIVPIDKKLTFGPVIGEVTSTSAIIVIEIKFQGDDKDATQPLNW